MRTYLNHGQSTSQLAFDQVIVIVFYLPALGALVVVRQELVVSTNLALHLVSSTVAELNLQMNLRAMKRPYLLSKTILSALAFDESGNRRGSTMEVSSHTLQILTFKVIGIVLQNHQEEHALESVDC